MPNIIFSSISSETLKKYEPEHYEILEQNCKGRKIPEYLYFNKGL